ncbi:hypothetical protein CROQUDRAFT_652505 [Cronartium quercuum f. sp. fusiforme G11]|uniref:Cytoplasmic tRNA adenylyltransferase 1 n=1 Tax=Cronartium quercuum f. sp. fusiforme G11 TaxID=708437 RepID=A0A9P6NQF7_9BASI|nr:hypothetical protein CROQUDRAFT_652505 [Cronartium quercuum f. sp. fusiforme G11]
MAPCALCPTLPSSPTPRRAIIKRPKTAQAVCRECFYLIFETEIHNTILGLGLQETERAISNIEKAASGSKFNTTSCGGRTINEQGSGCHSKPVKTEPVTGMFRRGERVAIAASGGKDSTVLAHVMTTLNARYDYGLDLCLLSIDEGIKGYRDDSLETVKRNSSQYSLPLKVLSYDELYQGWTMDKVVENVGRKGNCTFCGVFRRQALDKGADILGVDHIVTGHNADDVAETVLMNVLRGDIARLERCTEITTGGITSGRGGIPVKRSKPFKYAYEKEIVMYAYFKKLDYFSTECTYSPEAYRGHARALVKELERIRPSSILDIIYSGEAMASAVKTDVKRPTQQSCSRCGSLSSQALCQACALIDGLNAGTSEPESER